MRKQAIRITLALTVLLGAWIVGGKLPDFVSPQMHVQAQGFEPFARTFTLPTSHSIQYVPACTTGSQTCIPNFKQVGHTITYDYATGTPALIGQCTLLFDGSTDNKTWQTLAASGNTLGSLHGSFSANTYFTYYRIKEPPCIYSDVTITYVGYSTALPIDTLTFPASSFVGPSTPREVADIVVAQPALPSPGILAGFQCANPDPNNTAYLQLFLNTSPAVPIFTLGSTAFMTLAVPPSGSVFFNGPALSYYAVTHATTADTLYAGASTVPGGTGVALTFDATPTAGGAAFVQGDVGGLLTVTSCGAQVAITQVNGGSGTGGVTQIATTPTTPGSGCLIGTGQVVTGGTGTGAKVSITALVGSTAVTTPIWCNFQVNSSGPYYPFNPPSP